MVGTQSLTWFAGFRYFNVGERLNLTADGVVPGEVGNYNIRTRNNLYGAQLGARFRRTRGRFGWDATGQAGIFGNDAQQSQFVQDFPAGPDSVLRNVSTSRSGVAFVGQGNLSGLYALTNVWNLRAGYNVIWIEGLALAPDQLDFNFATAGSGTRVNNDGGLFLHGVNVGLEARW
ncbi:MAG: BBP7 family outer membrane beta-barrel protein [Planctomycetaceae bacterium]|nr:BBP7 family outer membrane beta-barrel protein [Planctomycetaceae bacterium]